MDKTKRRHTLKPSMSMPSFDHIIKKSSKTSSRSVSFTDDDVDLEREQEEKPKQNDSPKKSGLFSRRYTMVEKDLRGQFNKTVSPQVALYLEEDTLVRHERQIANLHLARRNTMVGVLGFGRVPKKVTDLVKKKRNRNELTWEEMDYFIRGLESGLVCKEQAGAMMIAFDLVSLSMLECEFLMKAMIFSGQLLHWPGHWVDILASLQSTGSTGNKAKPIVAAAMAAIGLKFPIMSARGTDIFACTYNKMTTIPGFDGKASFSQVRELLEEVGCCVIRQPKSISPAETMIRDLAAKVGISNCIAIRAACIMARVCAMKLRAVVLEITCGPSESIQTRADADELVNKVQELSKIMGIHCKVICTHVDGPVGRMIGQSLSVLETIRCLNGVGPADLKELVCKIGGHVLQAMNRVDTAQNGEKLVAKVLDDGAAKKKFVAMLLAQGVERSTVKNLFKHRKDPDEMPSVLPTAHYFTHLTTPVSGFVHAVDTTICNNVMYELAKMSMHDGGEEDEDDEEVFDENNNDHIDPWAGAGGIQLMIQVGSYLNTGECWAKIHHNVRLTEEMTGDLNRAIKLKVDPPLVDMSIDMKETSKPIERKPKKVKEKRKVTFTLG